MTIHLEKMPHLRTTQNDEAYWTYQDTLQKSDVHFQSFAKFVHTAAPENTNSAIKKTSTPADKPAFETTQHPILKQEPRLPSVWHSATISANIPHINETSIQKIVNTCINMMQKIPCNPSDPHNTNSADPIRHTITFKQHQLFLQGNEAEIALNTLALNPKQTQALQELIREWLTKQGFRIKKLVINGVAQW